jgi:hypothetical protein
MKQKELYEPVITKTAVLSDCKQYRYFLIRTWDDNLPRVLFIMLNPSTADAIEDDNTIRRCKGYAKDWGYGGFYVINLFAFRSKTPADLLKVANPIGSENETWFRRSSAMASLIVCAWGNSKIVSKLQKNFPQYKLLSHLFQKPLHYLELSKDGTPKHPLYLSKELKPNPYK